MSDQQIALTPQLFVDAVLAYQKTAAITAAVELRLFDAIGDGGAAAEEIAARIGAAPRGVRILCDFLTVQGFLAKQSASYRLTPVSATFIASSSPRDMSAIVRLLAHAEFVRLFMEDPVAYVRRGGTEGLANMEPEDPIWVTFARSMTAFTIPAAGALASHVTAEPTGPRKVLEIAAGAGMFGIHPTPAAARARVGAPPRCAWFYCNPWPVVGAEPSFCCRCAL